MKQYHFSFITLCLSFISFSIGLYLGLSYDYKWFGNFGALIVLFGVASEYSLLQYELRTLYKNIKGQGGTADGNTGIPDLKPKRIHANLATTSHIIIIIGTLTWGFGEWFLCYVLENA